MDHDEDGVCRGDGGGGRGLRLEVMGQYSKRLGEPGGHGWESGCRATGGGYKTVAAAVGVGRARLER